MANSAHDTAFINMLFPVEETITFPATGAVSPSQAHHPTFTPEGKYNGSDYKRITRAVVSTFPGEGEVVSVNFYNGPGNCQGVALDVMDAVALRDALTVIIQKSLYFTETSPVWDKTNSEEE